MVREVKTQAYPSIPMKGLDLSSTGKTRACCKMVKTGRIMTKSTSLRVAHGQGVFRVQESYFVLSLGKIDTQKVNRRVAQW